MFSELLAVEVRNAQKEIELLQRITPHTRQNIYNCLEQNQACAWLALITAQHVLPVFEKFFEYFFANNLVEDELKFAHPANLLKIAEKILSKTLEFSQVEEDILVAQDVSWAYVENNVPVNVVLSATSAQRALDEACGFKPFRFLHLYNRKSNEGWLNGKDWADEQLAISGGDAASAAFFAYCCKPESSSLKIIYATDKGREFWEWWLNNAIPQALKLARSAG